MDKELITELMETEGLSYDQAVYVATARAGELALAAERWDGQIWQAWREQIASSTAFVVGWDLACQIAGNPAA